jgi:phage replication initiation protein
MPSHSTHGEWLMPTGKGRTLYVGRFANGKGLCIYEKGKQLGDVSSPWVRWELRLGSKDRLIPLDALTRPAQYFAGGYDCLEEIASAAAERIRTIKHTAIKSLDRLVTYARQSYGKLVSVLLEHHEGDCAAVAAALRLRGVPASLSPAWVAAQAAGVRALGP